MPCQDILSNKEMDREMLMTAEERMAYFQGEKRRSDYQAAAKKEASKGMQFLKLRFLFAVILFVAFLSLDYTGMEVHGIGSERIIQEVVRDLTAEDFQEFYKRFVPIR